MSQQTIYTCDRCGTTGDGDGWYHVRRAYLPSNYAVYRVPYDRQFCSAACAAADLTPPTPATNELQMEWRPVSELHPSPGVTADVGGYRIRGKPEQTP